MKRIIFISLVILAVLISPNNILAKDYFVSLAGKDNNDGSELRPFRTIQTGVDIATAGDTVYVKKGTYNERVFVHKSGSKENHIKIKNYKNDEVILDGSGLEKISRGVTIGKFKDKYHANYIWIEGFEIRNYSGHGIVSSRGSHHNVIKNIHTHHNKGNGIYMFGEMNNKPGEAGHHLIENCHAEFNLLHGIKIAGVGTRIINCTCNDNNTLGLKRIDGCGLQVSDYNWDVTITGGKFFNNQSQGIRCAGKNITIDNVQCFNNKSNGLKVTSNAKNVSIRNSFSYRNRKRGLFVNANAFNVKVFGSEFFENKNQGIKISGNTKNILIRNSKILSNKNEGILINSEDNQIVENIEICNNEFYKNIGKSIVLKNVNIISINNNRIYSKNTIKNEIVQGQNVTNIHIQHREQ